MAEKQIEHAVERLDAKFPEAPTTHVEAIVEEARESLAEAPVQDHVPTLVERRARDRLAAERA